MILAQISVYNVNFPQKIVDLQRRGVAQYIWNIWESYIYINDTHYYLQIVFSHPYLRKLITFLFNDKYSATKIVKISVKEWVTLRPLGAKWVTLINMKSHMLSLILLCVTVFTSKYMASIFGEDKYFKTIFWIREKYML